MIIIGPLWLLNLILVFLNFVMLFFLGLTQHAQVYDFSIKGIKNEEVFLPKSDIPDLNSLFDRDLFNTQVPVESGEKLFVYQPVLLLKNIIPPLFPSRIPVTEIPRYEQEILPPLQIVLRGTIISDNPLYNKVFIENLRTKEEKDYIIGDIIEDAQIVFIGKTQVNLIRSNGQEEIIYLNKLLKIEEEAIAKLSWEKICSLKNGVREINTYFLKLKIKSLTAFIDELGLVTYFENNLPQGCLVTTAPPDSLGSALGLLSGDVLVSINDFLLNSVDSRISAYEFVLKQSEIQGFLFKLKLLRNNNFIEIDFHLFHDVAKSNQRIGVLNMKKVDKNGFKPRANEKYSVAYNDFKNSLPNKGK